MIYKKSEGMSLNGLSADIKRINGIIDDIYTDIIKTQGEKSSAESMLKASTGTRLLWGVLESAAGTAFVIAVVCAFIKGHNIRGLELLVSYGMPSFAAVLVFDMLRAKYRRARMKILQLDKRLVKLNEALVSFKADRDALTEGAEVPPHIYIRPEPVKDRSKNGAAAAVLLAILFTVTLAGIRFRENNSNRVEVNEGISSVVLNDGFYNLNEAGGVSNTEDASAADGRAAVTIPGSYSRAALDGENKVLEYSWDYNFAKWTQTMEIPVRSYEYFKNKRRNMNGTDYRVYIEDKADDEFIKNIADSMCANGEKNGYDDFAQLELMVSFVQGLDYIEDKDADGNDIEYPKYPVETLCDKGGDCEDSCILLASLIRARGYGVALLRLPDHVAVGIKGSPESVMGSYYELNGERYYYIETTSENWPIGEIPDQYKGIDAEVLVIE